MSCELFTERLMAYLEHETDEATRAAIERHSVTCAECGALLADLRKLRIDSANLPELQPSRDLWSGIATRIEAPVVSIGGTVVREADRGRVRSIVMSRWMRGAMIAASLVAAAGVGYLARGAETTTGPSNPVAEFRVDTVRVAEIPPDVQPSITLPRPDRTSAAPPAATVAPPVRPPEVQLALATLTADYDREIARLRVLIEQRRNQLDPATVAVIEKNLQVIDTAIDDSKKAIATDPASRFLIESLNQSLRSKVELMRTAALLPSRT
ncbi:MAG: zf-HC2 domain-containing protein [Gemmatimonadaceae bacterium]